MALLSKHLKGVVANTHHNPTPLNDHLRNPVMTGTPELGGYSPPDFLLAYDTIQMIILPKIECILIFKKVFSFNLMAYL